MPAIAKKALEETRDYDTEPRRNAAPALREQNADDVPSQTLIERVVYFMNSYNEN